MSAKEPKKLQVLGKFGKGGVVILGGAKVGQTIVVTAVDDKGQPTEWKAVNPAAKLSDLENDLFYNKKQLVGEFTKDNWTVDEKGNASYKFTPQLPGLTAENFEVVAEYSINGKSGTAVLTPAIAAEDDALYTYEDGPHFGADLGDALSLMHGGYWDNENETFVVEDSTTVRVYGAGGAPFDFFTVKVYAVDAKKIPGEMVEDMYYTEPDTLIAMLPEQTLDFTAQSADSWPFNLGDKTPHGHSIEGFVYADHAPTANPHATFDSGMTFRVMWDGATYDCHAGDVWEMLTLGNAAIISDNRDNTGEPFCIMANPHYQESGLWIAAADTAESHTVSVCYAAAGQVHPMPVKYLPTHAHDFADLTNDHQYVLPISMGGTGAINAGTARGNLGLGYGTLSSISLRFKLTFSGVATLKLKGSLIVAYNSTQLTAIDSILEVDGTRCDLVNASGQEITSIPAGYHLLTWNGSKVVMLT